MVAKQVTKVTKVNKMNQAESHVLALMQELGFDMEDENHHDTPRRVVGYLKEFIQPFDPEEILGTTFPTTNTSTMVVQHNIPFRMACAHHLLPALGFAAVGYIPRGRVVGLSKITRLVDAVGTEKPSLQEDIAQRIATILEEYLEPLGCGVIISAEHGCMACRGVNKPNVMTTTSTVLGVFRDVPAAREEFFRMAQMKLGG